MAADRGPPTRKLVQVAASEERVQDRPAPVGLALGMG
jgi:hypothetical protein